MNPARAWADYPDADAHKLLTDNRELTFLQSQRTRDGVVAPFPRAVRSTPQPLSGRAAHLDPDEAADALETYEGICGLPDDIDSPLPLCEETK